MEIPHYPYRDQTQNPVRGAGYSAICISRIDRNVGIYTLSCSARILRPEIVGRLTLKYKDKKVEDATDFTHHKSAENDVAMEWYARKAQEENCNRELKGHVGDDIDWLA